MPAPDDIDALRRAWAVDPVATDAALKAMTPEQARSILARAGVSLPIWRPQSYPEGHARYGERHPQQIALSSEARIIGFGGAAGGGKTDLMLGCALTQHRKSIIFRSDYGQIREMEERVLAIAGDNLLSSNSTLHVYKLKDGRQLDFGGLDQDKSWLKFQGRPHDLIAFDEATNIREKHVRALMAWLRSTDANQRLRCILTFNPPTDSNGEWVIAFFAPWLDPTHPNPAKDGEIRWFVMAENEHGQPEDIEVDSPEPVTLSDGRTVRPISRTFVHSSVQDNAYYAGTEYESNLDNLPEPLRSQMRDGNFEATAEADPWQIIPTTWAQAAMKRHREGKRPDIACTKSGVDVAHGGRDETVVANRYGNWIDPLARTAGVTTPDGKTAAEFAVKHIAADKINVDAIGYGASCAERLSDAPPMGYGLKAIAINVASKDSTFVDKSKKFKMLNQRAEMYWRLREALDPDNGHDFCLPDDRKLLSDLCAPRYKITPSGIQVESKDDIKSRLGGRSTDSGDAVALTMLETPAPDKPSVLPRFGSATPKAHSLFKN